LKKLEIIEDGYFKRNEVERLETSISRYIKQKESFSERSPVELRYMWDARVLSQEYNFYGLIESTTKSEYSQNLSEYEKRMREAGEQVKNIEGYGIEKEKIIAVASKWRERKNDYDNMPNDGDMSIDFSYPNQSDEMISLSSFRGSIVYVDVWATWCGPCIAEIPSLEKLQKDYEDKDIVFLSVSVDTDKEAWDKMLVEDHLGGVQVWADGWSEITKSYAIFGIPRFILVDKAGSLISVDAPRPSSNEIRLLIEENI
jgi:thiol-disulfide isomerase/thioredoxin